MTPEKRVALGIDLHNWWATFPLTAWTCRIIACDPDHGPPKACVLLLVSGLMMLCAVVLALVE